MNYPLMPLRIPSGWIVGKNGFYDADPSEVDGPYKNAAEFAADMLFLRRDVPPEWESQYIVDLGWSRAEGSTGIYRLTVVLGSWDHVIKQFESGDRYEIQRTLDGLLDALSSHVSVAATIEALEKL